jgi:spore maturation protein CgeB
MSVSNKEYDLVFIGSDNPSNKERNAILSSLEKDFNITWFGKKDTNEIRSTKLNELFSKTKIVVGDSVYSPHYWSNRIVETLGRGGFLIHKDVEGLKEEYPHLITYTDYEDLKSKITYYLEHDIAREEIVKKNFEWVRDNYTCDKKCAEVVKIYEKNCIK